MTLIFVFCTIYNNWAGAQETSALDSYRPPVFGLGDGRILDNADSNVESTFALRSRPEHIGEAVFEQTDADAWRYGPGLIRLNGSATIDLPSGYRYLPPEKVAQLTHSGKQDTDSARIGAPYALVGPSDGSWNAKIIVLREGYVPTSEMHNDDAVFDLEHLRSAMQENERNKFPLHVVANVMWIDAPTWDDSRRRLDWAYMVLPVVNASLIGERMGEAALQGMERPAPQKYYNSLTFGRRDVVLMRTTGIDDSQTRGLAYFQGLDMQSRFRNRFNVLADSIRFDRSETYADYSVGDRVSKNRVNDFISGDFLKPQPGLLDRLGWLASPKMLFGYSMLFMLLMRLRESRKKRS